jgi:calcium-dependent protein kinase
MPAMDGMAAWLAQNMGAVNRLHEAYEVDCQAVIGAGSFGKVVEGRSKASGDMCAIKQIPKATANVTGIDAQGRADVLKQEIDIMQTLDHRNIVRLYDWFDDPRSTSLVMQLCTGGMIVDFAARMQEFREADAAVLMEQVLSAMSYLHKNNIVHRDVKPDNMLLKSRRPLRENTLKLIDFGLSCRCKEGQVVRLSAGTPEFISPQAIDGRYDTKTDMWSVGVSMYFLLCGYVPFRAQSESGTFAAIKRGNFTFAGQEWSTVSDSAKDAIRQLLKLNPQERCTAEEALSHDWIRQEAMQQKVPLHKALGNFRLLSGRRRVRKPEANTFADVRSVLNDVTQWANSVLPNNMIWDKTAVQKPVRSFWP